MLEVVATVISGCSLGLSLYTYFKTRRLRSMEEQLNQLLLEKEQREASSLNQAELSANIVRLGSSKHRLKVFNRGRSVAHNVEIAFPEGNDLVVPSDIDSKFPLEALDRGQSVELWVAAHMRSKRKLAVQLTWEDADGTTRTRRVYVML